jgi:transcriptional regulator with XRE-family HTH domain
MDDMRGARIRQERQAQERSLADVATKAKISIATLSRIETDKQALDLGMFLTLARVLDVSPAELLGGVDEAEEGLDPMVRKIVAFETGERTRLWKELAEARRQRKSPSRRTEVRTLALQVEELLAQIDFLRQELEAIQKRLKKG